MKLGDAFAMVFSGAQAATRVVGSTGVSLAVVDDVMARALAVLISGCAAREMTDASCVEEPPVVLISVRK